VGGWDKGKDKGGHRKRERGGYLEVRREREKVGGRGGKGREEGEKYMDGERERGRDSKSQDIERDSNIDCE
jgi:hypothetical protein